MLRRFHSTCLFFLGLIFAAGLRIRRGSHGRYLGKRHRFHRRLGCRREGDRYVPDYEPHPVRCQPRLTAAFSFP